MLGYNVYLPQPKTYPSRQAASQSLHLINMAPGEHRRHFSHYHMYRCDQGGGDLAHADRDSSVVTQFEVGNPPNDAISSLVFAPDSSHRLLVSSWDKNLYLYEIKGENATQLVKTYPHRAPVLDASFGANSDEAFTAGMDWHVRRCVVMLRGSFPRSPSAQD